MDALISVAMERALGVADLASGTEKSPEAVRTFCDTFARRLVDLYLDKHLSWAHADAAANNIYSLMVQECGDRVPDYAWEVYLAFDTGECTPPGGDAVTRPLIEEIVARHATEGYALPPDER